MSYDEVSNLSSFLYHINNNIVGSYDNIEITAEVRNDEDEVCGKVVLDDYSGEYVFAPGAAYEPYSPVEGEE
jgi:hypothetical protein